MPSVPFKETGLAFASFDATSDAYLNEQLSATRDMCEKHGNTAVFRTFRYIYNDMWKAANEWDACKRKRSFMKSEYWDVTDEQVIEKTGKPLAHWEKVLATFKAKEKKPNDVVAHLQNEHKVPRYWARTLTTRFLKQ